MINKRTKLSLDNYVEGIKSGDRTILGRAISLVESNAPAHQTEAQELLTRLLPETGKSIRVGITGVPGAGKSTLIETLGLYLIEQGHRVAVLAVDPTSSLTGGSILGDKTRMAELSQREESFIRPSPSGTAPGGVARKTRESLLVCEAAGYDVILVETVGVGQNEIAVRAMVDFFLLLQITGAGDDLQGIKRGILEIADAIFFNKADGDNKVRTEAAGKELALALHYLPPATEGWQQKVGTCSALTGDGIEELWSVVLKFSTVCQNNGLFDKRRRQQAREWIHTIINEHLHAMFLQKVTATGLLKKMETAVMAGEIPATKAAERLVEMCEQELKPEKPKRNREQKNQK